MSQSPSETSPAPSVQRPTDAKFWQEILQKSAKLPADFNVEAESAYYADLFQGVLKSLGEGYSFEKLLGAGGSGTVFLARPRTSERLRAVKLPRKAFVDEVHKSKAEDQGTAGLNVEVRALDKLSHPNIVRLHDAFEIEPNLFVLVMAYVPESQDLDAFLIKLLESDLHSRYLNENVFKLARIILEVADGLAYMHDKCGLYHFDLKPSNILVDPAGTPYITDLGFAREASAYDLEAPVKVGFTWRYAHPRLRDPYSAAARVSRTPAKCKAQLRGSDLSPIFDIFSLGRTFQECLAILEGFYHDRVHANYEFNFLHLVACLMLDGRNTSSVSTNGEHGMAHHHFASDVALGYPVPFFQSHKFNRATQVLERMRRLLGMVQIEAAIPEMNPWYPKIVNASDLDYVVMTPRVEAVVNHPAFQRLAEERQLGLLDRVYPTATHTRANHSLGTFLGVCLYLEALYRDPDVPTFKVTIEVEDLKRAMIAALIHDLGQTALGHDFEEIDESRFDHKKVVERLLTDKAFRDGADRTLHDIIEGNDADCWSVKVKSVIAILDGSSKRPIDGIFTDCINGTIDADKLDYLVRDSVDCRVSYGKGIDVKRFLRSLTMTVAPGDNSRDCRAVLSIRRKGFAAMQALALTRYEMHCALYWHHTFRALKSMILDAAARCFLSQAETSSFFPHDLDSLYYDFVICGTPWEECYRSAVHAEKPRKNAKGASEDARVTEIVPRAVRRHRAMEMLWRLGDNSCRRLLESALAPGELYRRIFDSSLTVRG
jgi:HD superfamily phosphohydrolase/serine/threonine protein kinase